MQTGIVCALVPLIRLQIEPVSLMPWSRLSCAPNVWSPVISPCHNGYSHYLEAALRLMYTKYHMLIQFPKWSRCARQISRGRMSSVSGKPLSTNHHCWIHLQVHSSAKKRRLPLFVGVGRKSRTKSRRPVLNALVRTRSEAEKDLKLFWKWVDESSVNNASTTKTNSELRFSSAWHIVTGHSQPLSFQAFAYIWRSFEFFPASRLQGIFQLHSCDLLTSPTFSNCCPTSVSAWTQMPTRHCKVSSLYGLMMRDLFPTQQKQ